MSAAVELAVGNILAWSIQVGVLGLCAALLARLLPIERPSTRLAFGQGLLAAVLLLPMVQPWSPASRGRVEAPPASVSAPMASPTRALVGSPAPPGRWAIGLAGLLLLGAALHLARLALGLSRLRALRRRALPLDAPAWLRALRDELAPRAVLVSSPEVVSPATFGVARPVVVLPLAFASMTREEQEAVALHEILHARRGDWLPLLVEELLNAVFFFHPTVRWLVGRVRLAREQSVDAAVVERLGAREAYLDSLVAMSRLATGLRAVPAASFLRQSHLRERVDLLLKGVAMTRARTLAHLAGSALGLVLVATWVVSAAPLRSPAPEDSGELVAPARFVSLTGDVQVKRAGTLEWTPADPGASLDSLDLVRTLPGAEATLAFASGARITLRPDSILRIDGGTAPAAGFVSPPPSDPKRDPWDPHEPRLVRQVRPAYPLDAKAESVEGIFLIDIVIGRDGTIRDAQVVLSAATRERLDEIEAKRGTAAGNEGDPRLARAALEAIRQWRYAPVIRDGEPAEVNATAAMSFRIR